MLWVSDREPGVRQLFAELLPEAEVLAPDELLARLSLGQHPDALIIDGTQLLELPTARAQLAARASTAPRSAPACCSPRCRPNLISGPGVAVLAKPFCVEDLEAAVEWLRGVPGSLPAPSAPFGALVQRRRARRPLRGRLPAH